MQQPQKEKIHYWTQEKTPDGKIYYLNLLTKQTTFKKPEEIKEEERSWQQLLRKEKTIQYRKLNDEWLLCVSNLGHYFYHHVIKRKSQWKQPKELNALIQSLAKQEASQFMKTEETESESEEESDEEVEEHEALEDFDFEQQEVENQHEPEISEEEATAYFKSLLSETKNLTAFSIWEKEKPQLEKDSRFHFLTSDKLKKQLFTQYCSQLTTKDDETNEKSKEEQYWDLMLEQITTAHSKYIRYEEFYRKFKTDKRLFYLPTATQKKLHQQFISQLKQKMKPQFTIK